MFLWLCQGKSDHSLLSRFALYLSIISRQECRSVPRQTCSIVETSRLEETCDVVPQPLPRLKPNCKSRWTSSHKQSNSIETDVDKKWSSRVVETPREECTDVPMQSFRKVWKWAPIIIYGYHLNYCVLDMLWFKGPYFKYAANPSHRYADVQASSKNGANSILWDSDEGNRAEGDLYWHRHPASQVQSSCARCCCCRSGCCCCCCCWWSFPVTISTDLNVHREECKQEEREDCRLNWTKTSSSQHIIRNLSKYLLSIIENTQYESVKLVKTSLNTKVWTPRGDRSAMWADGET